jgi:ubiquitin-protein ligase E3 C
MFTTFSGSTRRPRNVNLGGRKTNPFGNASTGSGAGSQAALDRAQQDRAQRQRERDTLNAAKRIQRVWRGHASRQQVADELRHTWDGAEASSPETSAYGSEQEALAQLQRLLRFASSRKEDDVQRIQRYGARRMRMAQVASGASTGPWASAYLKLEHILLTILQRQSKASTLSWSRSGNLFALLHFVADQIPSQTSRNAKRYYHTLADAVTKLAPALQDTDSSDAWEVIYGTVISPLKTVTPYTLDAYEAFGYIFLPLPT